MQLGLVCKGQELENPEQHKSTYITYYHTQYKVSHLKQNVLTTAIL
jgi:hypothetical protein